MMDWADLVNGTFEIGGGFILALNVRQILKDKAVRGVHWGPTMFFFSWGVWNLYYYPSLNQWWSFCGGLMIASVNFLWLSLMLYYLAKERGSSRSEEPWNS